MPGRNRTGPMGMGPMTGRGAGYCAGYGAAADTGPMGNRRYGMGGFGRGAAMWGGGGRVRRRWFSGFPWSNRSNRFGFGAGSPAAYQETDPEMEKQALQRNAEALQTELEMIQKRLAQMEKDDASQ